MTERLEMINVLRLIKALLAQLVELLFCNQQVGSSSLSEGTNLVGYCKYYIECNFVIAKTSLYIDVKEYTNQPVYFGGACTKSGEIPLHGICEEFDSLRLHQ